MAISPSAAKYLLTIYHLGPGTGSPASDGTCVPVRSARVADSLGVSRASVVKMLRTLSRCGLASKEYYGCIHLTDAGLCEARSLDAVCRKMGCMLCQAYGVSQGTAQCDALTIACALSPESRARVLSTPAFS